MARVISMTPRYQLNDDLGVDAHGSVVSSQCYPRPEAFRRMTSPKEARSRSLTAEAVPVLVPVLSLSGP